jgi:hypothetical protein
MKTLHSPKVKEPAPRTWSNAKGGSLGAAISF